MRFPILGELKRGTTQRHRIKLPGAALADDEPRPVVTITGAKDGPVLFVNGGLHGSEYPAIEAVIRLGQSLDPQKISGTVMLMPCLNLAAFRARTPFVCPIDNVNPNRVFPGDSRGSYSEQMTHALMNEFVRHADAYVDLHGGDIPEDLVPFVIARAGEDNVARQSKEMAIAFGLPYVLTVSKPVQPAKGHRAGAGTLSSYAAAAEAGVPAILAEAGGVGRMQEDAVQLLANGVVRVMEHLGMLKNDEARMSNVETGGKQIASPAVLTAFEWVYAKSGGMWYPGVKAGDRIEKGQQIGRVGDLFGETLGTIVAPVRGTVLFLTINPSVQDNGLLMGIGVE